MSTKSLSSEIDCTVELSIILSRIWQLISPPFSGSSLACTLLCSPCQWQTHACLSPTCLTTMKEKSNHAQFVVCPWKCRNWSERFAIADWRMRVVSALATGLKSIYGIVSHSIYRISWPKPATLLRLRLWRRCWLALALGVCSDDRFIGLMTSRWRKCVPHVCRRVCVCMCVWVSCLPRTCSLQRNHFYNWHAASQKKLQDKKKKTEQKVMENWGKENKNEVCNAFS